jgi:hypothetical protein
MLAWPVPTKQEKKRPETQEMGISNVMHLSNRVSEEGNGSGGGSGSGSGGGGENDVSTRAANPRPAMGVRSIKGTKRSSIALALALCASDDSVGGVSAACVIDLCSEATLPMYDFPEIRNATDEWWSGVSAHVSNELSRLSPSCAPLPPTLSRELSFPPWRSKTMCFSQTCGFPLTNAYREDVLAIATPHYAAEGCSGHLYSSVIVVRDDSPLVKMSQLAAFAKQDGTYAGVVAVNSVDSHSVSQLLDNSQRRITADMQLHI